MPYPVVYWLNDDILLGIFHCYRLDEENGWNDRLGWCKLSHVCQRWRHLVYECSSYLGMHIQYTNSSPMANTINHLPPLPLFVNYSWYYIGPKTPRPDELGIYHILRLHGRIYHIALDIALPSLHEVLMLMNENFPRLEYLSLTGSVLSEHCLPPTLPKAFLAPNLQHLTLSGIGLPKRLRVLTSTVSLVTLTLRNIQTSIYFRPRLLVARLRSLPLLEELTIVFSIPIPRPSTERELLGEEGAPITLPSLKLLMFRGVGAYLESLVAQIRVPLLEKLYIRLFNQIAFVLPHLFYLINIIKVFQDSNAMVDFHGSEVSISRVHNHRLRTVLSFGVMCKSLDWQIDCAAQICHALIPTLSGVEHLWLSYLHGYDQKIPTEMRNGGIDSATWHDLLRPFIGVKHLYISAGLLEELSRALQEDEVGSDPGFLPNLQYILGENKREDNLFNSFIDTRQVVGRPVQFQVVMY